MKKKIENKLIVEKEIEELTKGKASTKLNAPTRKQIQEIQDDETDKILEKYLKETADELQEIELDPKFDGVNINRQKAIEEEKIIETGKKIVDVTGVGEALENLTNEEVDLHPEKRVKAVYLII